MLRLFVILPLLLIPVSLQAQEFLDVPEDTELEEAVEYLAERGVIAGYEDDTFRPDQTVNRAEAIKIILAPLMDGQTESQPSASESSFQDVHTEDWFAPYVSMAFQQNVIDGPPIRLRFEPERSVQRVEFLKMHLLAYKIDPQSYSEIRLPLATDVEDPEQWYYPYIRYAVTASMIQIEEDILLHPDTPLTRGEAALLLYRYLRYQEGKQIDVLQEYAQTEILFILEMLEANNIQQAEYASARALLAARGALTAEPQDPQVQATLKMVESFRALVRAYRAGTQEQPEEVIRLAGDAWNLASRSIQLDSRADALTQEAQALANEMADQARSTLGKRP